MPELHWDLGLLYFYNIDKPGLAADELELNIKAIPKKERVQNRDRIAEVRQDYQEIA